MSSRLRTITFVSTLAGVVLITLAGASVLAVQRFDEARAWVAHTDQVILESAVTVTALIDVETGQRGFLLTQDPAYLKPFEQGREVIGAHLQELRRLTADNPGQLERVAELERLANKSLALSAQSTDDARAGRTDAAVQAVKTGDGKRVMDEARAVAASIRAEEERLWQLRQHETTSSLRLATGLTQGASAGLIVLGILLALIHRSLRARDELERALRGALQSETEARAAAETLTREVIAQSEQVQHHIRDQAARIEELERGPSGRA